jgi:hypothetical protein
MDLICLHGVEEIQMYSMGETGMGIAKTIDGAGGKTLKRSKRPPTRNAELYTVTVYPERKNAAIAVTWRTPTGHARSLNLGCHALRVIETQSGLPDTSNGQIAFELRIPLPMLVAIQAEMGIDSRRRRRAYVQAIERAIAMTRELGFPIGGANPIGVPLDFNGMLLPEKPTLVTDKRRAGVPRRPL